MVGIFHAGRIKRNWVTEQNTVFPSYRAQISYKRIYLVSHRLATRSLQSNPKLTIRKDWSLITRSGSIGRMAYTRPDMDGMACSEDVLRVIPNPDRILPGYLHAFLSSKFGMPVDHRRHIRCHYPTH